jgi:hypothetical protein
MVILQDGHDCQPLKIEPTSTPFFAKNSFASTISCIIRQSQTQLNEVKSYNQNKNHLAISMDFFVMICMKIHEMYCKDSSRSFQGSSV